MSLVTLVVNHLSLLRFRTEDAFVCGKRMLYKGKFDTVPIESSSSSETKERSIVAGKKGLL